MVFPLVFVDRGHSTSQLRRRDDDTNFEKKKFRPLIFFNKNPQAKSRLRETEKTKAKKSQKNTVATDSESSDCTAATTRPNNIAVAARMSSEEQPKTAVEQAPAAATASTSKNFLVAAVETTGRVLKKVVDATVLDMSPHGTCVDGVPRLDGKLAKDIVDHTVLDVSPHGTNVDGTPRVHLVHHDQRDQ